jgi:hypothetical protein
MHHTRGGYATKGDACDTREMPLPSMHTHEDDALTCMQNNRDTPTRMHMHKGDGLFHVNMPPTPAQAHKHTHPFGTPPSVHARLHEKHTLTCMHTSRHLFHTQKTDAPFVSTRHTHAPRTPHASHAPTAPRTPNLPGHAAHSCPTSAPAPPPPCASVRPH